MLLLLVTAALAGSQIEVVERYIDAPPAVVWSVLTGFSAYEAWNPWLLYADGEALPGAEVVVVSQLGGDQRRVVHEVTEVIEAERLCWKDTGWFTLFATGDRCRTLTPEGSGTRLRVELRLSGLMTNTVEQRYGDAIRAGMWAELDALARHAEAQ